VDGVTTGSVTVTVGVAGRLTVGVLGSLVGDFVGVLVGLVVGIRGGSFVLAGCVADGSAAGGGVIRIGTRGGEVLRGVDVAVGLFVGLAWRGCVIT
jgi:hypothetical protein